MSRILVKHLEECVDILSSEIVAKDKRRTVIWSVLLRFGDLGNGGNRGRYSRERNGPGIQFENIRERHDEAPNGPVMTLWVDLQKVEV